MLQRWIAAFNGDSDGDGVSDGNETSQGSDPNNASDNGLPPSPETIRELHFRVLGVYAAWEARIEGLGPADRRVIRLARRSSWGSTLVSSTVKLCRGNDYRITLHWLGDIIDDPDRPDKYDWFFRIEDQPLSERTYDDGDCTRIPGAAEYLGNQGWLVDNTDGLFSNLVYMDEDYGGNVAGGLEATLHIFKDVITPDWNRDKQITETDRGHVTDTDPFWMWVNDDADSGDTASGGSDLPGQGR